MLPKSSARLELVENAIKPRRAHQGDGGLDIAIQEDFVLSPYSSVKMPAGVKLHLPPHLVANVMTRSGTSNKGVSVIPTLIDCNYHEEISTIVSNFSDKHVKIKKGDMLAQVVITYAFSFENEDELLGKTSKQRGQYAKFGSSGN